MFGPILMQLLLLVAIVANGAMAANAVRAVGINVPSLPQDPRAKSSQRDADLKKNQKIYRWSTEGIPAGAPFLEGFPPEKELPRKAWTRKMLSSMRRVILGTTGDTVGAIPDVEDLSRLDGALLVGKQTAELVKHSDVHTRPRSVEDYGEHHHCPLETPTSKHDYQDDDAFARNRLQGGSCAVIEKCTQATRDKLKILDLDPEYEELRYKVDSLMARGKLLVVDHGILEDVRASPLEGGVKRYLAPSIALFEVVDDVLPIKPIGIQLREKEAAPIFTPEDGYNWMIAKACFESADVIVHEVVSHLGLCHLVMEGVLVAMNRQLPKAHPIHVLLDPHLEGTAFINFSAQVELLIPNGHVDRVFAPAIEDTWSLTLRATLEHISKDFSPPEDFKARGVTKEEFPGYYPFRECSTKYWEATYTWVKDYLDIYYKSEADIEGDYELKAFVDEMVEIAQFQWLSEFYHTNNKRELIAKVLASLIHTASTQHAAVNGPQRTQMSYVPSAPGSVYAKPPTDKTERTFSDYLAYLPPLEIAAHQTALLTLLGDVNYTKLGQYEPRQFLDGRVKLPLRKFQRAIQNIEAELEEQNAILTAIWKSRGKPTEKALNFRYVTLLPRNIPQSINI